MNIEEFDQHEIHHLLDIFNRARQSTTGFPNTPVSLDEFKGQIDGERLLVARLDGQIAGFISVWEADHFIHHLFVHPHYQGKGIGQRLLQFCIAEYGRVLTLKCIVANTRACQFYERNGWRIKETANGPEGLYRLYVLQ